MKNSPNLNSGGLHQHIDDGRHDKKVDDDEEDDSEGARDGDPLVNALDARLLIAQTAVAHHAAAHARQPLVAEAEVRVFLMVAIDQVVAVVDDHRSSRALVDRVRIRSAILVHFAIHANLWCSER